MSKTIELITKQMNEWIVLQTYSGEVASTLENLLQNIELEHLDPLDAVTGYISELDEELTKVSNDVDKKVLTELLRFLRTL